MYVWVGEYTSGVGLGAVLPSNSQCVISCGDVNPGSKWYAAS